VSDRVVVLSTVGTAEDAARIARALVERRLAACVNVLPGVRSFYRWKGAAEEDEERLLVIKTYELPEAIVLPIEAGHAPYLAWIDESVGT